MYVCICKGITDSQIKQAIDNGADYKDLRQNLGVATDCGQCSNFCKKMLGNAKQGVNFYEASAA